MENQTTEHEREMKVSVVELFFDLVFVFTLTQLTYLVGLAHAPLDYLLVILVLILIWWMYTSYTWLTNETGEPKSIRLVLFAGQAGFFAMALALPKLFGGDGLLFGCAFLFVVVVHLAAFLVKGGQSARSVMRRTAPFNLGAAAFVMAAGLTQGAWNWLFFLAAATLFIISTIVQREQAFATSPAHFAERHAAIILIAFGESLVAIGAATLNHTREKGALAAVALSLVLIAALWWSYFDQDYERAEHILVLAPPKSRPRLGLLGYWYTHLAMIAGIVLIATGVKQVIVDGGEAMQRATWLLAVGVAIFLLGDAMFRRVMGIRPVIIRSLGTVIVLPLGALGALWGSDATLLAAVLLVIGLLLIEQRLAQQKNAH